jgi:hypothetical protein
VGGRVDVANATIGERPADALLIRPDSLIAWAATLDESAEAALPALREALTRWFGAPVAWRSSAHRASVGGGTQELATSGLVTRELVDQAPQDRGRPVTGNPRP